MNKINIKTIFICGLSGFKRWIYSSQMIILAALAIFIYLFAVQPLADNSALMEQPLNVLEPYIAALNSGSLMLIIPLGFLAVSSDFPKNDGSMMFALIRTGRLNWLFGQLINLLLMCIAYLFFVFAASVVPVLFNSAWDGQWSKVVLNFGLEFPEYSQNFGALLLPKNLFNHLSLFSSVLQSSLFALVYLYLLGMILLFFAAIGKKSAGVALCGGLITAGSALCSIRAELMWWLPMSNSVVWLHFTEFRREPQFPIWCSWVYFAVLIGALFSLCMAMIGRLDCVSGSQEER